MARGSDITWDDIKPDVARISLEKQRKYSEAIKFLQKCLQGHGSKMFQTLKLYGAKLSKSQQRYTIPLLSADKSVSATHQKEAEGGVCLNMTLLWLKEQFDGGTLNPRLKDGNVIKSEDAYSVTKLAVKSGSLEELYSTGARFGLTVTSTGKWPTLTFDTCNLYFEDHRDLKALVVCFYGHAVGLFRESGTHFLFYDANAGSYRVAADSLRRFLTEYNNVCLPKKWPATATRPAYNLPVTERFSAVFLVSKA
jgi:hypothetical protein